MNWLARVWMSLNWDGQRARTAEPAAGEPWFPAPEPDALDAAEASRQHQEYQLFVIGYSALAVLGWAVPEVVYWKGWARSFVAAMGAITPQIENIRGISGARVAQNQFLFAALWAFAIPITVAYVLARDARRWKLPVLREKPRQFVTAIGTVAVAFLMASWFLFTEFQLGARVSYVLLGPVSAALWAPLFVFGPLLTALLFANYLVRLVLANVRAELSRAG